MPTAINKFPSENFFIMCYSSIRTGLVFLEYGCQLNILDFYMKFIHVDYLCKTSQLFWFKLTVWLLYCSQDTQGIHIGPAQMEI